jgi:MYXO-CTERM domain-containing protein
LTVDSNSTEITGLNPGTFYEITVSAVNERGESDVSDSLNIRTAEAPIPLPETPVGFNAECTTDTCDFSWEMPIGIPERPESSPVALFAIKIRPVGGAWGDEIRQEETTMRLTDLPSNTEFEVEIYSVSADGFKSATPLMANFRTMAEVIIPDAGPDSTDVEELDAGDVTVDVPDTLDAIDTVELDAADVLDTELDSTETPDVQQDIAQDANLDTSNDTGQDAALDTSVDAGNDAGPDVEVSPDTDSGRPDVVVADAGVDALIDTEIGVDSGSEQPREPRDPGGCSAATNADVASTLGWIFPLAAAAGAGIRRRRKSSTGSEK